MARTVLETPGEDVGVFGGQFDVYGTTTGGEEITILSGTDVWLDPSFNTGGDTIRLPGEADEYTARVEGSYVILESTINDVTVEIPVGPAGITIVFGGDDSRTLMYDTTDGRVEIDGEPIDSTADPLSPGDDGPPAGQIFNLNEGSETTTGTEGDDQFRASNEELGSGDVILGLGGNDELQVFVDQDAEDDFGVIELDDGDIDYAGFETDSVEQVLITNDSGFDVDVDLSGAEGVELVGSVNSSSDVQFNHVNSLADVLLDNLTIASGNDVQVYYRAGVTAGGSDEVDVTIIDSSLDELTLGTIDNMGVQVNTGIETVNLTIDGDSTMNDLDTELTNLNISGTGDLVIDNPLEDTVRDIDAVSLVGDLDIDFSNNTAGVDFDGSTGDNMVDAGAGSDNIITQGGDDTIFGNDGNDTIDTNAGDDAVYAGNGNDTVDLGTGTNYAELGDGQDFVTATEADGVTLAAGFNQVYAGTGDDTVVFGDGGSWVDLNAGDDTLTTGAGGDLVITGTGNETISTGAGSDQVIAYGDLNSLDIIDGGADSDWLYVNAGTVDVDYTNVSNMENLVLLTSGATVLAAQAQQAGIVTVYGTSGNDDINASAYTADLTMFAYAGTDTLISGTGDDTFVFNGDGYLDDSDVIAMGDGLDTINSTGSIHLDFQNHTGIDVINLYSNSVGDSVYIHSLHAANADETGTLVINAGALGSDDYFELNPTFWGVSPTYSLDVTGGAGGDSIQTGTNDDIIRSGAGNDFVEGLAGDDDMHLGAGDDTAYGDVGADRFYGDTGADDMYLGVDADVDTVLYANLSDSSFAGGDTRDSINEFDSGEDVIDISELLANNGISSASTEFITGQDLDQAEAQMVAGDGVYSIVFIEEIPGDISDIGLVNTTGYFFVDLNDDGELGGEDLQVFINGDDVQAGDVDTTLNISGESGYDIFLEDIGMSPMAMMKLAPDANFA